MIIINSVVLIGRIVRDPELKFIPSTGMGVTKMTLAVDKDLYGDKKQQAISQGKPTADFINVTVFGKMAESCANYLAKGSQCAVHGRISTGSYEKQDGTKVYTTEILADKVEFLGSKEQGQAKPQTNSFDDFPGDEDIFTPVEDGEDLPF